MTIICSKFFLINNFQVKIKSLLRSPTLPQNSFISRCRFLYDWKTFLSRSQCRICFFSCFILLTSITALASPVNEHQKQIDTSNKTLTKSMSFNSRHKRDEDPASVFGKGVAFWLGEQCETTCNRILFHVWCNLTTHRCECLPEYPVNVDNKYCLKALRIDEPCEFTESCQYMNPHAECNIESNMCKCLPDYFAKYDDRTGPVCVAYGSPFYFRIGSTTFDLINNIEFVTGFSLILSFILIIILSLTVIKLMHKNKQLAKNESSICDRLPPPPPIILNEQNFYPRSLQSSPHSFREYNLTEKPLFIPPLPHNIESNFRRQSLSSLHSQSSFKSYSSLRSQNSNSQNFQKTAAVQYQQRISNTIVRAAPSSLLRNFPRKASSPMESSSQNYMPNHLPPNHLRIKCANTRCGTGQKVRSEICLVHNPNKLQEELFVPNN